MTKSLIYRLIRLDKPTGLLLLIAPALFAVNLSSSEINFLLLFKFLLGGFFTRSAGCIINDYFDIKFDQKVARTKSRPLAAGEISAKKALYIAAGLSLGALVILLTLSPKNILLGFFAAIAICIYPLMKRFTYFPQVFLGLTFNLGILMAFIEVKGYIGFSGWVTYVAFAFWTISYDIVYAFQDIEDDKKAGVKSMAIILGKIAPTFVELCNIIFVMLLLVVGVKSSYGVFYIISIVFILLVFRWQKNSAFVAEKKAAESVFKSNNIIALAIIIMSLRLF